MKLRNPHPQNSRFCVGSRRIEGDQVAQFILPLCGGFVFLFPLLLVLFLLQFDFCRGHATYKSPCRWGVSNTKCCFDCYAGNCIYGHPNSRNIVVVRIFYFHRDPFAFWGKPFPFQFHSRFANFREKEIQKRRKKFL